MVCLRYLSELRAYTFQWLKSLIQKETDYLYIKENL